MFTYGYIREATMARLDIDETEAEAMHLLERFPLYANEAMQAICASKPMYQYIDVTVVKEYAPLVRDGAFLRPATDAEIEAAKDGSQSVVFASEADTINYYHERSIYKQFETMSMSHLFIAFAYKAPFIIEYKKPTPEDIFNNEAFGTPIPHIITKREAEPEKDFAYTSQNKIKFYKTGKYQIPAKYFWFQFESGMGDDVEIDMPVDILMTIPIYIASICYQVDNERKAQILRNEFELALARCTATDFMPLPKIKKDW